MFELSDIDKGYIAGTVDSDGSIGCTFTANQMFHMPFVMVGQKVELVPSWLYSIFGGTLKQSSSGVLAWQVNGRSCIAVLELINPFLRIKKRQGEVALALARIIKVAGHARHYTEKEQLLRLKLGDVLRGLNVGGKGGNQYHREAAV